MTDETATNKPKDGATGVAVWGLGNHALKNILPALEACPDVALVGAHTRNAEVADEVAGRYGCTAWAEPGEMLADPKVDAVVVATPIGLHHIQGKEVLEAGKHLWMEKPFSARARDAEALLALAGERDLAACEGFMFAYHPQYQRLLRLAGDPEFGRILSITCRFGLPHLDPGGFRYSPALGGGARLDVGCYPVAAVLGLMAGEAPDIMASRVRTLPGYQVDIDGIALLEFSGGATACLEWGLGRGYKNEIEVWGEHGSLFTNRIFSKQDSYQATITVRDQTGNAREERVDAANAFALMFSAFSRACSDESLAEAEGQRILRQASLLEQIGAT